MLDRVTYTYPGEDRAGAARRLAAVEPGEFVVLAGRLGVGQVDAAARRLAGSCRTSTAASSPGRLAVGGLDTREHGPAELAAVAGTLFQEPETQVVMGTVRSELAFPLENRGLGAAAVARGVEEAALALGIARPARPPDARAVAAASCSGSRSAPRWPGGPRCVLLDEPTSQLDPVAGDELLGVLRRLNEEWGTAVRARRAPARALPGGGRPRDRARGRRDRAATAARGRSCLGRRRMPWLTPGRAAVRARGPAAAARRGSKEARAALGLGARLSVRVGRARDAPPASSAPAQSVLGRPLDATAGDRRSSCAAYGVELRSGPAVLRGLSLDAARRARRSR